MPIAVLACRAQIGLQAPAVQVEVSLAAGLPAFNVVGRAATVMKESKGRVRAALLHSGFEFPAGRITVNLSPADMPKRSGRFDLPIALGILTASGQLPPTSILRSTEFYGELGLDGELKAVAGMLLATAAAQRAGREVLLPCASEAEVTPLLRMASRPAIRTADHLRAVCAHMQGTRVLRPLSAPSAGCQSASHAALPDLNDVRGQAAVKRALVVAAAGSQSLLKLCTSRPTTGTESCPEV